MMKNKRACDAISLYELISENDTHIVIPPFQREYQWDEEQVEILFKDLKKLQNTNYELQANGEIKYTGKKDYFFGIILYFRNKKEGFFGKDEIVLIDGQQRTTTIILFFHAIRNILSSKKEKSPILNAKSIKGIETCDSVIYCNDRETEKREYRLRPYQNDYEGYELVCANKKNENANNNITSTYKIIDKKTKEWMAELESSGINTYDSIGLIIQTIQSLGIAAIELSEEDDSQEIFESVNSKGKDLEQFDLVKNYLLLRATKDSSVMNDIHRNRILPFEKMVNESGEKKARDEILRHFLAYKSGNMLKGNRIYQEFKSYFEKEVIANDNSPAEYGAVLDVLDELIEFAKVYIKVTINYESTNFSVLLSEMMALKQTKTLVPIVCGLYIDYESNKLDENNLKQILKTINSYMYRRLMCDLDVKPISRLFPHIYKEFRNSSDRSVSKFNKILLSRTEGTKESYFPDDKELRTKLKEVNFYQLSISKHVLTRIENHNNNAPVQFSICNIEHVAPITATPYWNNIFEKHDYNSIVNLIGNLTLASHVDNSSMGNRDFESKKKKLADTDHIKMNKFVISREQWDYNAIMERTDVLATKVCEIWGKPQ
jgi:uncharacterized protein with ParB-like and HNH nuclease domain